MLRVPVQGQHQGRPSFCQHGSHGYGKTDTRLHVKHQVISWVLLLDITGDIVARVLLVDITGDIV